MNDRKYHAPISRYRHHYIDIYKHPRTLLEAFGCDSRTAYPIQRFKSATGPLDKLVAVGIGCAFAALLFFQLSK